MKKTWQGTSAYDQQPVLSPAYLRPSRGPVVNRQEMEQVVKAVHGPQQQPLGAEATLQDLQEQQKGAFRMGTSHNNTLGKGTWSLLLM